MAIFTVITFIGYIIINGSNLMFKSQLNTTNNQMSINTFSKYISKDIQNSISVEGPIFSESKPDGSEYTLNNIEKNDEVEYIYTIETKKNGNISYIVSIKDNRYSISREGLNNVTLNIIDNEKLLYEGNLLKAPLTIELKPSNDKLYYISLEYKGETNKEGKYNFEVTSRYEDNNTEGNTNNDCLIFKYTKKNKINYNENYNWEYTIKGSLEGIEEDTEPKENASIFSDSFLIRRYGEQLQSYTSSWYQPGITFNNSKVKEIKGFRLKFQNGIVIKNIKFMGKDHSEDLDDSKKVYTFKLDENTQNVEYGELLTGNVEIEENSKIGDTYTIEIEFIY